MKNPSRVLVAILASVGMYAMSSAYAQQPAPNRPDRPEAGQQRPNPDMNRPAIRDEVRELKDQREDALKRLRAARASGNQVAAQQAMEDLRRIDRRAQTLRQKVGEHRQDHRPGANRPDGVPPEVAQDHREIRQDRQEIREGRRELQEDKAEIREGRQEIREDRKDLKEAIQSGDRDAAREAARELRQDQRELRQDQAEFRDDRRELHQDRRELREDVRDHRQDHRDVRDRDMRDRNDRFQARDRDFQRERPQRAAGGQRRQR